MSQEAVMIMMLCAFMSQQSTVMSLSLIHI